MIYLLKSEDLYKIGYTKDFDARLKSYKLHNPNIEVLDVKEGSIKDESELHKLCENFKHGGEWYNSPEVIKIFKSYNSARGGYEKISKPENMLEDSESIKLDYKGVLIYAYLHKYTNESTNETFVTLKRLSEDVELSIPTIGRKIKELEKLGCLSIKKSRDDSRSNIYVLGAPPKELGNRGTSFNMILNIPNDELSPLEKAGILMLQHKMEKDESTGHRIIKSLSIRSIANLMGIGKPTVNKMLDGLRLKKILSTNGNTYDFDLHPIYQAVFFIAGQVQQNTEDIELLKLKNVELREEIDMLKKLLDNK